VERLFTAAEATALLPQLTELLTRLQAASAEVASAGRKTQRRVSSNGATPAHPAAEAGAEVARTLGEITDLGVVVRDPTTGLIDFPAERDGEPIYLCWRLGEDGIGFWHPRDTGFAGREPL
jgi:hypothetical protein